MKKTARFHFASKPICAALMALGLIGGIMAPSGLHAANHTLSRADYDATTGVSTLTFTMSVDWDLDNPPPGRDKAYIQACLDQFALSLFAMTEGKIRVGKVKVYHKSRYLDNADILLLNKDGRANANISGWGLRNTTMTQFYTFDGRVETPEQIGKTIAHEFGHYGLGILDEYVGSAADGANGPMFPGPNDTPKNSMMNNHEQFVPLSTDEDYADTNLRKTAHYRIFSQSAWATITADPSKDAAAYTSLGLPKRPAWQGLLTMGKVTADSLKKPTAGYNAAFKIDYMGDGNSVQVIVIDRNLTADLFKAAKQAAEQFIRRAQDTSRVAILAYPNHVATPVLAMTQTDAAGKDKATAALAAINEFAEAGDVGAALSTALEIVNANKTLTDTPAVILYTSTATEVPQAIPDAYRAASVAISPVAIDTPGARAAQKEMGKSMGSPLRKAAVGKVLLSQLADKTQGNYRHSHNGADLVAAAIKASASAEGETFALVSEMNTGVLAKGEKMSLPAYIGANTVDGAVTFSLGAELEDLPLLKLSITDPSGKDVSLSTPPTGITVNKVSAEGVFDVVVGTNYPARGGKWLATVESSGNVDNATISVFSDSKLGAEGAIVGGTLADPKPLSVQVAVKGPLPVAGARVLIDIYDDAGKKVLTGIEAKDDGQGGDAQKNDGVYSVDLSGKLPLGEFEAVYFVENPTGKATYTTGGQFRSGANAAAESMGSFLRANELFFVHEVKSKFAGSVPMVEYFHAGLNHYFYSVYPEEQAALDTTAALGWNRTGQSFYIYPKADTTALATNPLCRFYGTPGKGPNSHFYTSEPAECEALKAAGAGAGWTFEGVSGYILKVTGACASDSMPLYRVYNNRFAQNDSNHRVTTDKSTYDSMIAKGWKAEGVVACVYK